MARERQEREDEFRLKEEQIRRERTLREQSMRKRNDRLSFLRRSNTSAGLFSSYSSPGTTYSSYSSYSSDNISPTTSYSYSANLATKWADVEPSQEEEDKGKTENSAHKNGDTASHSSEDKDNDSSLPFSSYKSSYRGPGLSFTSDNYSYSYKKKYGTDDPPTVTDTNKKETPATSTDYTSPSSAERPDYRRSSYAGGERLSTRYFPNTPRESVSPSAHSEPSHVPLKGDMYKEHSYQKSSYGTDGTTRSKGAFSQNHEDTNYSRNSPSPGVFKSYESPPLSSFSNHSSDGQYGSRRASEYGQDATRSTEFSSGSASSKPYDFSPFSNYLSSAPDLRYGGSRGTSPVFSSYRSEPFSPPSTNNSSRSTDDLLSDDNYNSSSRASSEERHQDEYSRESWSRSLPKRRSSRLEEQIEWEKQFLKERERRTRAREEEEQREEERIKLELKNQEILQNQKKMEKKRWEEGFATNFTKSGFDDHHSTGYVDYKQYHFRSPSVELPTKSNGTTSFTFRYNTGVHDRSPSPVKQFRSVHVQTSDSIFRSTPEGG